MTNTMYIRAQYIQNFVLADFQNYAYLCSPYIEYQGSKFHSSDHLKRVIMTVGQVEYLQDLSDGRLHISDFHISCIGFIYFRQVNGTVHSDK